MTTIERIRSMTDEQRNLAINLYTQYEKVCYFCIRKYYPYYKDNEDCEQEAKIGLWQAVCTYDDSQTETSLLTYIIVCIKNSICKWIRANKDEFFSYSILDELDDKDIEYWADELVQDEPQLLEFDKYVDGLDVKQKNLVYALLLGYRCAEVAKIEGVSRQAVQQRLYKLRTIVAKNIERMNK